LNAVGKEVDSSELAGSSPRLRGDAKSHCRLQRLNIARSSGVIR
jgi:hypothetical protein